MMIFKTNDGVEIYYEIHGEGRPLLMLPGWTCTTKYWKKNVDELSKSCKVIMMDLRAHGVVCSKRLLNQAFGKSLRTHNLKPKKGAQVMRKNEKITALYERLSRDDFGKDDDQQRESNSISNQKAMLEEFAARQGFTNIVHFTDDGISGTCFDRPGFLAMMKEVEAGNVEYLCIKDMSRMGRDYLKVGQIMEILRQRGVRLIAINDGVDSARGDDDFTPFRNIMNEYYARDTSRKIRSTFQSKGKSGKHLTGTVIYGYLWNEARDQWLVDPEAAEVVKRIFAMTIEGYGPYQIASKLKEEKVLIPSAYLAQHGEGVNKMLCSTSLSRKSLCMSVTVKAVYRPHRRSRFTSILLGDSFPRRLEKRSLPRRN